MKKIIVVVTIMIHNFCLSAQKPKSGIYDSNLHLAFDDSSQTITGFYIEFGGLDETNNTSMFSCIFYMQGLMTKNMTEIKSQYPNGTNINGELKILNDNKLSIILDDEHGGCWNVQHFTEEPVEFSISKTKIWKQIRFTIRDDVKMYEQNSIKSNTINVIPKNEFIFIEKINNEWAYCSIENNNSKGWILLKNLNVL